MPNDNDDYFVDYSLKRKKRGFDKNYIHSKKAKEWMLKNHKAIEKKYGIPEGSLLLLADHESGFDPYARSFSGVHGMFQFQSDTARGYGLRVDDEVDERLDYRKLADAAGRYVSDNLKRYDGDIVKAVAQWNGGNKVIPYLEKGNLQEYVSKNGAVGETHRFLNGLMKSAEKYGFKDIQNNIYRSLNPEQQEPKFNNVTIPEIAPKTAKESIARVAFHSMFDEHLRRQALANGSKQELAVPSANKANQNNSNYYLDLDSQYKVFKSGGSLVQLSSDGKVETILKGSERIFSRGDTKRLMELAKKAKSKDDLLILGKFLYDATKKQDSRPAEYVDD